MPGLVNKNANFGTLPSSDHHLEALLGAIFLRFGYAVGHLGFLGTLTMTLIGHTVTIPTAMAVAEIATNQKVQGGGAYFIISRSFGLNIGAAIGIALFIAQAISVSFYVIAFSEAADPLIRWLNADYGLPILIKDGLVCHLSLFFLNYGNPRSQSRNESIIHCCFSSLYLYNFFPPGQTGR